MAGILKIHSRAADAGRLGHSWIEYCPIDGVPMTFGTWGNNPTGQGNGLLENTEVIFKADATRSRFIDHVQEQRLFEVINAYRLRGEQAWTLLTPCSTFAAEAWEYATGEHLMHQTALISNPGRLVRSIAESNLRDSPSTHVPHPKRQAASPSRPSDGADKSSKPESRRKRHPPRH
jgi:hypothetical protein